jgi:transmembrane sensor
LEPSFDIDPIVLKYIREESLSPEESTLLRLWVSGAEDREGLLRRIKEDSAWTQANLARMQQTSTDPIWRQLESRLQSEGYWLPTPSTAAATAPTPSIIPMPRPASRRWWGYVIAATVIFILGGAWWALLRHPAPSVASAPRQAIKTDVPPGGNKAMLTLADGRRIDLDSSTNGVLANQGNMKVSKLSDGQLAYNKSTDEKPQPAFNSLGTSPAFNSLSTPRAGQFTLTLPDGSRVWLNNASTLRYPVSFSGPNRSVELTGEAYFEIAKDASHPFRVLVHKGDGDAGGSIEVMGTSFNIMAYADEPAERTTLVDGSIKFTRAGNNALLKPSQQSVLDAQGALHVIPQVNVQEVTAWKNGYFHFDHANLETTMRQLARWYDVDVKYQGSFAPQEFMGKIQRNLPLSAVLKGLENEQVHFKLEGRELTVMP